MGWNTCVVVRECSYITPTSPFPPAFPGRGKRKRDGTLLKELASVSILHTPATRPPYTPLSPTSIPLAPPLPPGKGGGGDNEMEQMERMLGKSEQSIIGHIKTIREI